MKLWHCANARSFRALWALEEMGLDYELEVLPFPPRVFKKDYLSINPLGTIPYLVDGDTHMTESSGICLYLVERFQRYELGLKADHPEYGDYLNWLFHSDATLTFPQTIYFRYDRLEPPERRNPQAAEDYRKWYLARLRRLNKHLESREFLVAGRFTVADIAIHYALFFGESLGLADDYVPPVREYLERLKQRPAFIRAQSAQAEHAPAEQ
ncbi:MAG: glutathione S-transferase [Gammaproteobacteria bacterium]|nr:glutathione S-transferase [Gammaproteobacteria bacterium]